MAIKTLALRGYLVAVHLALAVLLVKGDVFQRLGVRAGLLVPPDPPFIVATRAQQARLDPAIPAGAVLLVGDSNVQSMPTSEVAQHAVNLGIAWQTSRQLARSMGGYHSMGRSAAVVVMIGTNDVSNGLLPAYEAVLSNVPATVPVVLVSVPPVIGQDARPAVLAARSACNARPECTFVDAFAALDGKPGMLLPDGAHLTPAGYAALIPMLRDAIKGLRTSPSWR